MNAKDWARLKAQDEHRYRLARAMSTYLNHLAGAVDPKVGTWEQAGTMLLCDEGIIEARLGGLPGIGRPKGGA